MKTPSQIVHEMMNGDHFSKWLGLNVLEVDKGSCTLSMVVTAEMVNGFTIAHGGITYSIADSALAFASNGYGNKCVSIETSISHTRPAQVGDRLTAYCNELHRGKTIGIYQVDVKNQHDKTIALFKGTVHISKDEW